MQINSRTLVELVQELQETWFDTRSGKGNFVHILSSVGAGKSTLLTRFLESLRTQEDRGALISVECGSDILGRTSQYGEVEDLVARVAEGVKAIELGHPEENVPHQDLSIPWLLPGQDFLAAALEINKLPRVDGAEPPTSRADIFAGLLLDVAREHPVLLILDDADHTDETSVDLIEKLASELVHGPAVRLMVVITTTMPLAQGKDVHDEPWVPQEECTRWIAPLADDDMTSFVEERLRPMGTPSPTYLDALLESADGNVLVAGQLIKLSHRAFALMPDNDGLIHDEELERRPEFFGLTHLAQGQMPIMPANVRADLCAAALVGGYFDARVLTRLWGVPKEAALIRIDALRSTGLVAESGDGWSFISSELVRQLVRTLDPEERRDLAVRIGTVMRSIARADESIRENALQVPDVTDTWTDTRQRDRRIRRRIEMLWSASRHFADAGRHVASAEAAVTFVERLFESSGGHPYLAGRFGRRADRERRHRIYAALMMAAQQVKRAEEGTEESVSSQELIPIKVRLLTVRSRFKEVLGDFIEARRTIDMAVVLASQLAVPVVRLEAMRVQVEVCYASGDSNSAREALGRMLEALEYCESTEAIDILGWLAEAFGRWEWAGFHSNLFSLLDRKLEALGAPKEALKVRMEWLASAAQVDEESVTDTLLEDALIYAESVGESAHLAELLARYSADLIQSRADAHFDLLSGEFYTPDLHGEGHGPTAVSLMERMALPVTLMTRAEALASASDVVLSKLRVATTMLGVVYETRERFAGLLERWLPVFSDDKPVRLAELMTALEQGFFGVEHIESLTERICDMASDLGLDQIRADTLYEAIDREIPSAMQNRDALIKDALAAYQRVQDQYGMVTLNLVQIRQLRSDKKAFESALKLGLRDFTRWGERLNAEQRAFIHLRFGEMLLRDEKNTEAASYHLEASIELYDEVGDVEHVQRVAEILREFYRKTGDLGRYRNLRERFRGIDSPRPGLDPLGLELRVEHLLNLARQEANDERAIAMVERCVQLFGRMPDGTTRIDECFVEISKICRRRADEAQTEGGFQDWLQRSLDAVGIAASINRSLGNYHRVFEEYHELFDDLLGLGYFDEYVRVRAENRELAFAVGNVGELLYLFEEHLQYDPESGSKIIRVAEVRGFYEALMRYLIGLGAREQALSVQGAFLGFLTALGEHDLAEHYRARHPLTPE